MSVRHLAALADLANVPPTCKLVLFALALNSDPRGWSTASNAGLRRTTGLSERSVRETLKKLRALGYIEKQTGQLVKLKLA
jgi:DNA-binding Lrp family transcriptional regulator